MTRTRMIIFTNIIYTISILASILVNILNKFENGMKIDNPDFYRPYLILSKYVCYSMAYAAIAFTTLIIFFYEVKLRKFKLNEFFKC